MSYLKTKSPTWHNVNATTGEPITENSTPNLDDWGWDDYWDCSDWIEWHKIMKAKKGKEFADSNFLKWWNKQTTGAHALDCRSFNSAFRDFAKKEGLADALYSGVAVIAKPIGTAGDVISSGSNAISSGAKAVENVAKTLKIVMPIAIIGGLLIGGFYLYNKAKMA